MAHSEIWCHARWVSAIESVFGHAAAVVIRFVMMLVGLGLGVTMIMLPVGIVVGLLGFAILVGGLFAHPAQQGSPVASIETADA